MHIMLHLLYSGSTYAYFEVKISTLYSKSDLELKYENSMTKLKRKCENKLIILDNIPTVVDILLPWEYLTDATNLNGNLL